MKELSRDWQRRRGAIRRGSQLVSLIRETFAEDSPIVGAEIGVLTGSLSAFLLDHLPTLTLYMVDMWADECERYKASEAWAQKGTMAEAGAANLRAALAATDHFATRRKIIQLRSDIAARCFAPASLDFAFLDADHTRDGAATDIRNFRQLIKPGGLLCGHDYGDAHCGDWGVQEAVQESFHPTQIHTGADLTWWVRI